MYCTSPVQCSSLLRLRVNMLRSRQSFVGNAVLAKGLINSQVTSLCSTICHQMECCISRGLIEEGCKEIIVQFIRGPATLLHKSNCFFVTQVGPPSRREYSPRSIPIQNVGRQRSAASLLSYFYKTFENLNSTLAGQRMTAQRVGGRGYRIRSWSELVVVHFMSVAAQTTTVKTPSRLT